MAIVDITEPIAQTNQQSTSGIIDITEPISPKPVIKEANWWDTVSVAPGLAASNIVESAAGVADIVGADKKAKEWRQDAAAARRYVDEAYPVDPNSWKGAARGAATSIYTQAPGMALGLLTGGSTLPLTIMGTQAGTQKMSELIDAGVEKWKAVPLSMVSGAIEAFTEKIPFEKFIDIAKVSKGRAANIVKMMLYEQGGEQLATLGDQVIDLVKPDASWSWEDYKKAIIQTAKTTLFQTGTMATVAATTNKAAETVDRRRRKGESTPPVKTTTSTEIEPIVTGKKVKAAKARPDIQAGLDTLKEESKKELAEMLIENKQIEAEQSAQAKAVKNEEPINLEDLEALNQYSGKGVEADTIIKNELERLDKLNILEQEQVATQQNSVQNLNKAVVEQTNPEEAKWKKARQIALESGVDEDTLTELDKLPIEERKSWFNRLSVDNPTMVSLAAEKITEDEAKANKIAKWVDFQNRMQAKKVDRKPTNIDNVPTQTVSNFQTKLGNLLAEVGAKKIEDLTDEQLDRAEQIVEEAYDIGLDEAAEAPLNTKMSDETFEEIAKRIHKGKNAFFNKLYTSYFKNIDTQVEEEGHIPELDEVPKEVKKAATRRRQPYKVPLEDTPENRQAILNKMDNDIKLSKNELPLAKKMATEIREGKEKEDSINEMLGDSTPMTDREASEFAKQRTLDLLEDPEIKTNINKARSLLSNIYKFRPDTEEDAVGWLDKIRLAESTVKDIVGHKKIAFTRKAISKAVANKDISPDIGSYMNKVFNLLKVQPTFNLNWLERKESESSEGLYDFAQNLIKLRNPYALAHEVGHFAWYNVLTSEDRIAYMQHFINTYYTGNNLDFSKLRLDTTNPSNAVRNPAEAFACKFSDYTHDKVFSKIEMSLMKKVQAWFSELKNKLVRRRGQNVTYDGVERIFDKVLDKQVRRTWSESFGEPVTEQAIGADVDYSKKIPILMSDPFGLQTMYNRVKLLVETKKNAERDSEGRKILATIKQNDWGLAAPVDDKTVVNKDQAGHWERLKRSFLRPLLQSPSEIMGTILENHVFNINTAEHNIGFMYDIHSTSIDNIEADLIKDFNILEKGFANLGDRFTNERIKQTYKNVIDIAEGKKTNGTQAEIDAAARIRDWLDIMKDKQKAKLMKAFKQHLSKTEYNALLDLLSGISPEHIRVKFPKLSLDVLTGIAKEYQEISNWGIENYIPHMMRGQYKIVTIAINKEGKPYQKLVSVGFTEDDAVRKAADYLSDPENKDKKLFIDTSFKEFDNTKTSLNRKQYYAIMNKLAKQVKNMDSSINDKLAKEMARRAIKGQFSMKPTDTFSPFLQDREDILPGEDNIFPVLKAYAYSMEKKWALDDVIDLVRKDLGKMTTEQREWITEYIDDVKGRYGYGDKVLDDILGKRITMFGKTIYEGASTRTFSRAMGKVRALEANIKFGYRPVAGFVNLMSGQGHVWVKRGAKLWNEGRKFLNTDEGKSLIKEVERSLGTSTQDIGDTVKSKTPMWKPMGLFQAPESINRKMSVACAYLDGVSQGMTHAEARTYAIRACWAEQFTYNIANLPRIMRRSPAMRTFLQFKPYLIKEIEFMSNLSKGEALRYIGLQLALGGPRGAIMIAKTIPILMLFNFWQEFMDDAEEWMMKNTPNISMGVGGLPGIFDKDWAMNWMGPATIQFPSKASDLAGPFVGDIMRLFNIVMNPVKELSEVGSVMPIWKHWQNIWDLYFSKDNVLRDEKGNRVYEVKDHVPFIVQSIMGIENADINRFRREEFILYNRDVRSTNEKTRAANDIMHLIAQGKNVPEDMKEKARKVGVTEETLLRRVSQMNLTPRQRALVKADIRSRFEVFQSFPDESDSESQLFEQYDSPDSYMIPQEGDYY